LSGDPSNIEWVDFDFNTSKSNMSDDELESFCISCLRRLKPEILKEIN
jgi:hypothetical protein